MNYPLINRSALKAAMKGNGTTYEEAASLLGLSKSSLAFKISGRKGRGLVPFTEEEVQTIRSYFGDSVLIAPPSFSKPKGKGLHQ